MGNPQVHDTTPNTCITDSTVLGGKDKGQAVSASKLFQKTAVSDLAPTLETVKCLYAHFLGVQVSGKLSSSIRAQHKCRVSSGWCTASPQLINGTAEVLEGRSRRENVKERKSRGRARLWSSLEC